MAQSKLYHEALARFKRDAEAVYQDSKDRAILYDFLKEKGTPEDAKKAAEGLRIEAGSKYRSPKVGDTKIPQEWVSNILDNIGNFIQLGDYAITGAPESVGLAWYAIRLTLSAIQNNYELYNFFGAGLSNISEIMIIIPHYDRLYDERDRRGWKPSSVVDKLFKDIIETYAAVLDFSLSIKRHLKGGVVDKIRHGIKDFFNLQKGKFEGKLAAIAILKKKILEGCEAAFQERSLEGLDGMKDMMSGVRATVDGIQAFQPTLQRFHDEQLAKIDELQKHFAKFDEKLDGFEDNIKAWAKPKTPWELAVQEFDKINTKLKLMNDTRGAFRALAERRFPGTCEWVFDEGTYDPYYQWHQCQTGNLYCFTGREGTGKSIVLSAVVGKFETQIQGTKPTLLHVSCEESSWAESNNRANRSATGVWHTLLYQLYSLARNDVAQDTKLLESCNKAFQNPKASGGKPTDRKSKQTSGLESHHHKDDDLPEFASTFKKLADLIKVDMLVVVDAVDSLSSEDQTVLSQTFTKLQEILKVRVDSDVKIQVLIGSTKVPEGTSLSIDVGDWNASDIDSKLSAALRDIPGLSAEDQYLATERIRAKAGNRFSYIDKAIKFMREPLQRPLDNHLKSLPELGTRDKYDEELLKIGPNYARLLRTALKWAILSPQLGSAPARVIMNDFNEVYSAASKGQQAADNMSSPGFPPPSQLDMEQLKEASGLFLDVRQTEAGATVFVQDYDQIRMYCLEEHTDTDKHEGGELCARCKSEITQSRSLSISEKGGHLELAIACIQRLNNTLYQRRAGLVDDSVLQETDASKVVSARKDDKEEVGPDKAEQQPQETNALPAENKDGSESREAEEEQEKNEDGYDSDDSLDSEDRNERDSSPYDWDDENSEAKGIYYEIQNWPYHLREAEDWWTLEERTKNETWTQLFLELDKLVYENRDIFNAWQRIYPHTSYGVFNLDEPRKPLHVAAYLGLTSWAEHLINNRGEDPNEVSGKCNAVQAAACGATGRPKLLELLLEKGVDINFETDESPPAFHTWLWRDATLESVRLMIEHGANPAMTSKASGMTALHHFVKKGTDPEALDHFLSKEADINATNRHGSTPLHLLLYREEVPQDLLRAFVNHKADVNAESKDSSRPLQLASLWGELESLRIIFEPGIEEVDDEDDDGDTALQQAAINGHTEIVRFLAEKGADTNHGNKMGRTAMQQAAWNGYEDCVKCLLECGADPNKTDKHDRSPLFFACLGESEIVAKVILDALFKHKLPLSEINKPTVRKRTPLRQAASHGFNEVMKKLIDAAKTEEDASGLAIDRQDTRKEMTALHRAAWRGHLEAVRLLLNAGANVKLKDNQGKTVLVLAYESWALRHTTDVEEMVSLLIDKDAEAASADAELIAICAVNGSTRLLKQLRQHGADLSQQDRYGWSPLELAKKFQQRDTEIYLKQQAAWANMLPSRWLNPPSNTIVSEDGLKVTHTSRERLCISTNKPLPAGLDQYYFEVTLKEPPTKGTQSPSRPSSNPPEMAIGFCTLGGSAITFPGWPPKETAPSAKSWGYHSDDGGMYYNKDPGLQNKNQCYGPGDTVGCGVDFVKNVSWFTRNGEKWKFIFSGVHGRLFPLVGLHDVLELETNFFGPFMWRDGDEVNEGAVVGSA